MGVFVLPMPVMIDGVTYYEGQDLSHEQFFRHLSEHRPVSTSQPAIGQVVALWDRLLRSGYDELLYIPMSSGLSSSCGIARGFAQDYRGRVEVVDDHRISVTLRQSVEDAVALRDRGLSAREIRECLEKNARNSIIYVGVSTLEYLKASGRVTAAGAALGTALNIKPLLVIEGGQLDAYANVRGTRHCQRALIEAVRAQAETLSAGGAAVRIGAADSFLNPADAAAWEQMVREAFPGCAVKYDPLTFSIAGHVGLNAFGMGVSRTAVP